MRKSNRKHSKIDALPAERKEAVEQMLLANATYSQIIDYLKENGEQVSQSSLCRYAKSYHANLQILNIAQENFRRLTEEMQKYPDLDVTEAITRLAAQNIYNAIANTTDDAWTDVAPEKMLKEANALVRAVAYKQRVDTQNATDREVAFEEVKTLVFDAMRKENPELYASVVKFLNEKKVDA